MIHPLLLSGRFLFVVDNCEHCAIWKEFIENINSELRFDKRIQVIDCTRYHDFGVIDNPIIKLFMPYLSGGYPVLFFGGRRKDGTNTRIEAEAWLRAKVHNDFIIHQENDYLFNKDCEFGKKGVFKRKIVCR